MAIIEQKEQTEGTKKRRSRRRGLHSNIEDYKEEGVKGEGSSNQLKSGLQHNIKEFREEVANKENGSSQRSSRRVIGKAIVNGWEGEEHLETGEERQDGEDKRSRVGRKEGGEKKLRWRRRNKPWQR